MQSTQTQPSISSLSRRVTKECKTTTSKRATSGLQMRIIKFFIACLFLCGVGIADETPRFALLIGVAEYPNLGPGEQLDGCVNDVAAMKTLLSDRFGFIEGNITTLTNAEATGEGIRKAFKSLTERVHAAADSAKPHVVIHFSGHGSQVPDQPDGPDHDEDDGLDETWVPYDATQQGGDADIRDDELNKLVAEICDDGKANALLIFDCCHSGTGARGVVKTRQLKRDLAATDVDPATLVRNRLPEGAVFLSACRAKEVEPEFKDGDTSYGLLTRFLVATLSEERTVSDLSYELLSKAITTAYQRDKRVLQPPEPQLEGNPEALQRTILGASVSADRPPYFEVTAARSGTKVTVMAGQFHNVTKDSVYQFFERPQDIGTDSPADPLILLKITSVAATTSKAEVLQAKSDGLSEAMPAKLPAGIRSGFAVEHTRAPDENTLRLGVAENDSAATLDQFRKIISQQTTDSSWLEVAEAGQECDVIMLRDGNAAALFPATGNLPFASPTAAASGTVSHLSGGWGPIDLTTGLDSSDPPVPLTDYLKRIARARNLISLSATGSALTVSAKAQPSLELLKLDFNPEDFTIRSQQVVNPPTDHLTDGDFYALKVTNPSTAAAAVDVTVLTIGTDMSIDIAMPYEEPAIKLEPGESRTTDPFQSSAPYGRSHAILIATGEPSDFSFVVQKELPRHRAAANLADGSIEAALMESSYFVKPKTRGRRRRGSREKSTPGWSSSWLRWESTAAPTN